MAFIKTNLSLRRIHLSTVAYNARLSFQPNNHFHQALGLRSFRSTSYCDTMASPPQGSGEPERPSHLQELHQNSNSKS
jgi:hypothetical protein